LNQSKLNEISNENGTYIKEEMYLDTKEFNIVGESYIIVVILLFLCNIIIGRKMRALLQLNDLTLNSQETHFNSITFVKSCKSFGL
jgi:hypothetical protein